MRARARGAVPDRRVSDSNLKAAREMGFATVRVELFKSVEALRELERLVGFPLVGSEDARL